MTNEDLIISYLRQPYFSEDLTERISHGSLSYCNRVLYSYKFPIAIKHLNNKGHVFLIYVEDSPSTTTSKHLFDLKSNILRFFDIDSIIKVRTLDKNMIVDGKFNFAELISIKLNNLLEYSENTTTLFAQSWRRSNLISLIESLYAIAPLCYLGDAIEYAESLHQLFNSEEKINAIEKENKKLEAIKKKAEQEAALNLIATSKDLLFDMLCLYRCHTYPSDKDKFNKLSLGKRATKVSRGLDTLSWNGRDVLNNSTGFVFSFTRYGDPLNDTNLDEMLQGLCLSVSRRHRNYATSLFSISISDLASAYTNDGFNFPFEARGSCSGYFNTKIRLSRVTGTDEYISVTGADSSSSHESKFQVAVMELLHHFIKTLKEKELVK